MSELETDGWTDKRRWTVAAVLAGLAAAQPSCSPSPTRVAAQPEGASVATAPPAAPTPTVPPLATTQPVSPPARTCPTPHGDAPELALQVERIATPKLAGIHYIQGIAPDDVWFLGRVTAGERFKGLHAVLHFDGRKVKVHTECLCCGKPSEQPNQYAPRFAELWITRSTLHAFGASPGADSQISVVARAQRKGRWSCTGGSDALWSFAGHTFVRNEAEVWSLDFMYPMRMYPYGSAPRPPRSDVLDPPIASRIEPAFTRAWFAFAEPFGPRKAWPLLEYDGSKWREHSLSLPATLEPCGRLEHKTAWVGRSGRLWLISHAERPGQPGSQIVSHWDGSRWHLPELPAGFAANRILAPSHSDVWFLGEQRAYHWNGRRIRSAPLPLSDVTAAWMAPEGALWVAGPDASAGGSDETVLLRLQRLP